MTLKNQLLSEINATEAIEPDVTMFVDQSAIFWLSESGHYVHIADHSGIDAYVDADHAIEERKTSEGVGGQGVIWMNGDFENPYHISDFTSKIETINI